MNSPKKPPMSPPITPQTARNDDPLGDYVAGAGRLCAKMAIIAAHQRDSAASLSRAAAKLRAMAQPAQAKDFPKYGSPVSATRIFAPPPAEEPA
jgi:hypothetical protein